MAVTEVTSENWFRRILDSIKGIGLGILLFLCAFPLMFWNEGRAVKTAHALSEGASAVVDVAPEKVDAKTEGKLVHLSGQATTTETLTDTVFGVSVQGIKLDREVEMYQWKQNESTETRKKLGGGEEKVTTYTYEMVWDDDVINSSGFKEAGHDNPGAMPYEEVDQYASLVTIGGYKLSTGLIQQIESEEDLKVDETNLAAAGPDVQARAQLYNGGYYIGVNPASPTLGDLKVDFEVVRPTVVSVVAKQAETMLVPYETSEDGYDVELLSMGTVPAADMFAAAQSANAMMTWILRLVGFGMQFFGLVMIGRPFVTVAEFIPFIGSIFRVGVGLFAFLLSFGTSFITIAIAWIFYRPLLGLALLSLGVLSLLALVGAAVAMARRGKPAKAA